jgi:cytochrome P450
MMDVAREQYWATRGHAFYGAYMVGAPMLVVRSPEVAKAVLVKDFAHFVDRRGPAMMAVFSGKAFTDRIWRKQLLSLCGEEWKDVRATFSPIFTSGKMKAMMLFINAITERLVASFEADARSGREIELKDRFGRFSMDSIASCAFGMDAHAFEATADGSEFVANARSIFRHSRTDSFKMMLCSMPPFKFAVRAAGMAVMKPKETMFFYKVLKSTIDERRKGSGRRNDLIDMMIDAMREPTATAATTEDKPDQFDKDASLDHTAPKRDFDELTIVSTALVLLVAGYDTTAMTLSYLTYELAKNPDVQERLRREVDAACDGLNADQTPDYTTVQDLEYMDQVLHETLRRYPVLSVLQRACVQDYRMPDSDVVVRKGQEVFINVAGIHSDPEFYPEPNRFDPDRFSKENKAKRHP